MAGVLNMPFLFNIPICFKQSTPKTWKTCLAGCLLWDAFGFHGRGEFRQHCQNSKEKIKV